MARGNEIIVSTNPGGRFLEGPLKSGETPKPGTIMQIDVSAGIDASGNFTFEAYDADADGARPIGPLFVLLPDVNRGKLATEAYADGDHCFVYVPLPGEELNILSSGVIAAGGLAIVDKGTGLLNATTGTPESEAFMCVEAGVANTLTHSIYTGY